jgi:hypothetical protein
VHLRLVSRVAALLTNVYLNLSKLNIIINC